MARWLLTHAHYLNCVGKDASAWEYKEQDQKTKKLKRYSFPVPTFLDPNDESQWTFRDPRGEGGGIIVAHDNGKAESFDILFEGKPTPDMRPMDDEARALSAEMAKLWDAKPEELEGSYGDSLADRFFDEMSKLRSEPAAGVKLEGMTELLTAMTEMMKQNQQLLAALAKPQAERRL